MLEITMAKLKVLFHKYHRYSNVTLLIIRHKYPIIVFVTVMGNINARGQY